MVDNRVKIYDSPQLAAGALSQRLKDEINKKEGIFNLSISGGSTPKVLFGTLAEEPFNNGINWDKTHFWWCDERCVPPDDSESNFGMTNEILLSRIAIARENIHRIKGEDDPNKEAVRYAMDIEKLICGGRSCVPEFDWVLLGLGDDGHTASLFPGKNLLFVYSNIVGVAKHPESGQKRISLTKEVLNSAKKITFLVTGKDKAKILSDILLNHPIGKNYPAAEIKPIAGTIDWVIDKAAAFYL